MILEIFSSGPVRTNAILLGCSHTQKAVWIDAPFESHKHLISAQKRHQLQIEKILLTHSHWDHIAEAALLKKELGVPLYIHSEDAGNLEKPGSDHLPCPVAITAVKPDFYLKDGERLQVGDLEIEVIHTPGHTPGCVCFYLKKEKLLISGDTLFKGTIGNISFPTSRPKLMWSSLKKLSLLPPETRVIPGHGPETTIGAESWLADAEEKFR